MTAVNCEDVLRKALEAVDHAPSIDVPDSIAEHFRACPSCRRTYELQRIAKRVVRVHVPRVATPAAVRGALLVSLREAGMPARSLVDLLRKDHVAQWIRTVSTAGVAIAMFLLVVTVHTGTLRTTDLPHGGIDVVQEAGLYLQLFRSGAMHPPVVTNQPEVLSTYLEKNGAPLSTGVKSLWGWEMYGGTVTKHGNIKLSHVVGTVGSDAIYIFCIKEVDMVRDGDFHLPENARHQLKETGWFATCDAEGCPVVVWKEGNTICAAASTMKKDDLLSYLASR